VRPAAPLFLRHAPEGLDRGGLTAYCTGMGEQWQARAKCLTLSVEQIDALFFPSSGGKPHKAKKFCDGGMPCPVRAICLQDAIDSGCQGFISGTTEEERKSMKKNNKELQKSLDALMPPERKGQRLRQIVVTEDPHSWLQLNGPTEAQVVAQQNFLNSLT